MQGVLERDMSILRKRKDFASFGATGTVGRFFNEEYAGGGGRFAGSGCAPGAGDAVIEEWRPGCCGVAGDWGGETKYSAGSREGVRRCDCGRLQIGRAHV